MHLTPLVFVSLFPAAFASQRYSTWMRNSIISKGQGVVNSGAVTGQIEHGVFQSALSQAITTSRNLTWESYLEQSLTTSVPTLLNATVDASTALDRFSIGSALLWQRGNISRGEDALEALRQSLILQNRTDQGGLWYYVYPNWSYLDGMFSMALFYTHYYTSNTNLAEAATTAFDDVFLQLDRLWQHCHSNASGLHHGYDATKTAVWANPVTGSSPIVWGRSLGWYLTGLVETLDILPQVYPGWSVLRARFNELAIDVAKAADTSTGLWWQVVTEPNAAGNFLESSSSALFIYSILKGLRLRLLDDTALKGVAEKAYRSILDHFIVKNSNGTLSYNGTVTVCSLNSTADYAVTSINWST